ncbi:KANK1 [Cordylochernes scorpioides]|uniref:KANK1 n=1 Tax=Cordylochernes scorpioides TaxID=51811 RepID=A0ABY6KR26_9ARAC|nr:KANK1 [Cordylochernes scorpioides]
MFKNGFKKLKGKVRKLNPIKSKKNKIIGSKKLAFLLTAGTIVEILPMFNLAPLPALAISSACVFSINFVVVKALKKVIKQHKEKSKTVAESEKPQEEIQDVSIEQRREYDTAHLASIFGFTEIVDIVVIRTKNINVSNIYDNTPLHFSIKYKHLEVMQTLLRSGADINCLNGLGQSPLHLAIQYADRVMLGLLIKKERFSNTPLLLAVSLNEKDHVKLLLQNRANINTIGRDGCTPLHLALANGNK